MQRLFFEKKSQNPLGRARGWSQFGDTRIAARPCSLDRSRNPAGPPSGGPRNWSVKPGFSPRFARGKRRPKKTIASVFLFALWVFIPAGLPALGSAEKEEKAAQTITEYTLAITGVVRLAGSDPFPRLLISSDDGRDYIVDEESPARKAILSLRGRRVFMEALVREYPVYAGKKYLGIEYVILPQHFDAAGDTQ
jgi:hypothetical protein